MCGWPGPQPDLPASRATACQWWWTGPVRPGRDVPRFGCSPRRDSTPGHCPTVWRSFVGAAMAEWILGIETSCDETSAAVLTRPEASNHGVRSELAGLSILSQDVHRIFGGVVPELASRAHVQALGSVVDR